MKKGMVNHSELMRALAAAISTDGDKQPAVVLGRALGVSPVNVRKWLQHDAVPWRWRATIQRMAKRRGIAVPGGFTNPRAEEKVS